MQRVYVSDTNVWIDFRNADPLDDLFRLPFIAFENPRLPTL